MRIANIKNDYGFKLVFGANTKESNEVLRRMLSVFLEREVQDVQLKNTELVKTNPDYKSPRLDLLVQFNDGHKVDVEMQLASTKNELCARFEYYLASLHSRQEDSGHDYDELKETYGLVFSGRNLFDNEKRYYNTLQFRNEDNETSKGFKQKLIFIELNKLEEKDVDQMNQQERYMYYFNHCQLGLEDSKMKEMMDKDEDIRMMEDEVNKINKDSWEEANQMMDQLWEKEWEYKNAKIKEYHDTLEEGKKIGLSQGEKIGKQLGAIEKEKENVRSLSQFLEPEKISEMLNIELSKVKEYLG